MDLPSLNQTEDRKMTPILLLDGAYETSQNAAQNSESKLKGGVLFYQNFKLKIYL